jgi:thiol-disulfide isomerase/thioredoxin
LALATTSEAKTLKRASKRMSLPNLELRTLKGAKIRKRTVTGKVHALVFWATWCKSCKAELKALEGLRKKHSKQFDVIAIATDGPQTVAKVRGVARRERWKFPVAIDKEGALLARINPRGSIPYVVFVDSKGRIAYEKSGFVRGDEDSYAKVIKKLLTE